MTILLVAVLSYLLGSVPSGVIAARAFAGKDVLTAGSGHTGATNTFRTAGLAPALLTFLADGAKGVIAVGAARELTGGGWPLAMAAVLVVVGHCFPIYTRLRGGMGLATAGGAFLLLDPVVLPVLILAWFPSRWILRESRYATMVVAILLPVLTLATDASQAAVQAGIGVGLILFLRHLEPSVFLRRRIINIGKGN